MTQISWQHGSGITLEINFQSNEDWAQKGRETMVAEFKEMAAFDPAIISMLEKDPRLSEKIKMSPSNLKMLKELGTVKGIRMETLAMICRVTGKEPGEVISRIVKIKVESDPGCLDGKRRVGLLGGFKAIKGFLFPPADKT